MTKREQNYHSWHQFISKRQCPEFPYFGARYPDATCIDGQLWDLDSCDENGLLSTGDNPICPFCNPKQFIEDQIDSCIPRGETVKYLKYIRKRYS